MPPFSVSIRADDPEVVTKALRAAGMGKQADPPAGVGAPESFTALSVTVVFDAPNAASAEARVRKAVGDAAEVGPAKRVGDP